MINPKMSDAVKEKLRSESLLTYITPALWKSIAVYLNSNSSKLKNNKPEDMPTEDNLIEMFVLNKQEITTNFKLAVKDTQKEILKEIANQRFPGLNIKEEKSEISISPDSPGTPDSPSDSLSSSPSASLSASPAASPGISQSPNKSQTPRNINDLPRSAPNRDPWQRCMDRMARLLALGTKYSPCIAVIFDKNEQALHVSCNTPNVKPTLEESKNNEEPIQQKLLLNKIEIIKNVVLGSQPIETALKQLTAQGIHHYYGTQKSKNKRKYKDSIARLRADLEKLKEYLDKDPAMKQAFINAVPSVYIPQPSAKATSEHAEQVLAIAQNWEKGTVIGVNYLCCATCDEEIRSKSELQVQGTHGVRFPRVERLVTGRPLEDQEGTATLSIDLEASDSDSDSAMEVTRKQSKKERSRPNRLQLSERENLSEASISSRNNSLSTPSVVTPSSLFTPRSNNSLDSISPAMKLLSELIVHVESIAVNDSEYTPSTEKSTSGSRKNR